MHKLKTAYVSERCVRVNGEAFEQILVVIVLDHCRPVSLKQKTVNSDTTQTQSSLCRVNIYTAMTLNENVLNLIHNHNTAIK